MARTTEDQSYDSLLAIPEKECFNTEYGYYEKKTDT